MKKSEMVKALADNFCHAYEIEIHAETIIDFLVSQGMLPPCASIRVSEPQRVWDAQNEQFYEPQHIAIINDWEPEITQETIDQALEHIGKKGVRSEMEITE
jgi:hypothetical protein